MLAILVAVAGVLWFLDSTRSAGSGGIGSVSAGISEALVETALGLICVVLLLWVVSVWKRRSRGNSQ